MRTRDSQVSLGLDNETFEAEQSLPTQQCKQSVPLKKGFAAVATCFNPLLLSSNIKIVSCARARNKLMSGCLESIQLALNEVWKGLGRLICLEFIQLALHDGEGAWETQSMLTRSMTSRRWREFKVF